MHSIMFQTTSTLVLKMNSPLVSVLGKLYLPAVTQTAGLKNFPPPKDYSHVQIPERQKLPVMPRVPTYPPMVKPPKMQKNLKFIRGPEEVHNKLIHKQYGIIALSGGRLRHGHFEMIRMTLGRKIDTKRMFLVYRVDPPWQPITKKGLGHRMGGGKGAIDHYVTPVKAERVILELAGKCEFEEVQGMLNQVAHILPIKAMAVSQEILEQREFKKQLDKERNLNPWTMEYIIKNNVGNAKLWARKNDYKWFGEYI